MRGRKIANAHINNWSMYIWAELARRRHQASTFKLGFTDTCFHVHCAIKANNLLFVMYYYYYCFVYNSEGSVLYFDMVFSIEIHFFLTFFYFTCPFMDILVSILRHLIASHHNSHSMQNQIKAHHFSLQCWNHRKIPLTFNIQPNYWHQKKGSLSLCHFLNNQTKIIEEYCLLTCIRKKEEAFSWGAKENKHTESFAKTMVASE